MKTLLLIVLSVSTLFQVAAHDFYFGFAEVEYNTENKRFEGTIIVTTHDIEMGLLREGKEIPALETIKKGDSAYTVLSSYIFDHFKIDAAGKALKLDLIGFEVFMVGTTNLYFESEPVELKSDIDFTFDLLMNEFDGQQNKITFTHKEATHNLLFLHTKRKQTIKPENENNG